MLVMRLKSEIHPEESSYFHFVEEKKWGKNPLESNIEQNNMLEKIITCDTYFHLPFQHHHY